MNITTEVEIETRIIDSASGKQVGGNKRRKNLVLDGGLNGLALSSALSLSCNPATITSVCLIGSGNGSNSISSGAVTFTQAGTTITASGSFFTSQMTGWLFKYGTGTGGAESYITFVNATTATSSVSATVGVPSVATVWNVARTTLDTFLFSSATYQTNTGDCGSTVSGNQITHKRTYLFAQQGSPYTVNEIGYAPTLVSNRVTGRVVLGSSDNVGTSNFYVVVISLVVTYTPGSPLAVTNVGTNINTAGNLMLEALSCLVVTSSGATTNLLPVSFSAPILGITGDGMHLCFKTASYSQNGTPSSSAGLSTASSITIGGAAQQWVNDNTRVGSCTVTFTGTLSTTGQTLTGIYITDANQTGIYIDVLFTTPQTAPSGTFQPNTVWRLTYTRVLSN